MSGVWTRQGLEDWAIEQLDPLMSAPFGFKVVPWPDRDVDTAKVSRTVLAAIGDERWGPPTSFDGDQEGELDLRIRTIVQTRRGTGGQLDLRDAIVRLLTVNIPGAGCCYLKGAGLLERDGAMWSFDLEFGIQIKLSEMNLENVTT